MIGMMRRLDAELRNKRIRLSIYFTPNDARRATEAARIPVNLAARNDRRRLLDDVHGRHPLAPNRRCPVTVRLLQS